jgi:Flp pilus assembly protein TadG
MSVSSVRIALALLAASPPRSNTRPRPCSHAPSATSDRGQSLAEFAILAPLFLLLVIGVIEFSFAFNASLNTNYASRAGGLIAAEAGNAAAADCLILQAIEDVYHAPSDRRRITRIDVQRTAPSGATVYASSAYDRSGSMTCTKTDGTTLSVPYSAISTGYPPAQRCNVLPPYGCPTLTPARTTVDTIAVQITYSYPWHTPLGSLMAMFGQSMTSSGMSFVDRNVFRIEPVL